MWWGRKKKDETDARHRAEMHVSQQLLIQAATQTANAAHDVTRRLKDRLDDSVQQFENTARILNDALLVCDIDGTIQTFNPAAMRLFGRNDLEGMSALDLFRLDAEPVASVQILWSLIEHSSTWLEGNDAVLKGMQKNTHEFWIEPTIAYLEWSNHTTSVLVVVKNMDPIVSLKNSARGAKHRYNSIFETSFDGIFICQNGVIVGANPSASRIFAFPPEELIDRSIDTLLDLPLECHEDGNQRLVQINGMTKTGSVIDLVLNKTMITWQDGIASMITVKNVTDMRRLEGLAMKNRDNSVDMVVYFDSSYRITFCNDAFASYVGTEKAATLNCDIRSLLPHDDFNAFMATFNGLGANSPTIRSQVETKDIRGKRNILDWIDHVVLDRLGNPVEYHRIGRDISSVVDAIISSSETKIH